MSRMAGRWTIALAALAMLCPPAPVQADGGLDYVLLLDGSGDYTTMGQAPGLGAETFTLEVWFKRLGTGTTSSSGAGGVTAVPLICKGRGEADGDNRDCNYFFGIRSGSNVLAADFEDLASGLNHPISGTTPVQSGVWQHAAVTYDGATWNLYLDGELDATLTVDATPRYDSIQHFALGSALNSSGSAQGSFAGMLREGRVWDYARTQTQIQDNMDVEIVSETGLIGRWALTAGDGTAIADTSGGGHDGTLVGGLWAPLPGTGDGFALEFSGSSSYVTMGAAPGLGAETFTLEGWFKRTGAGSTASSGAGGVSAVPLICKGRGEADGDNRDCNYFFGIKSGSNVLAADFEDLASGLNHPVSGNTVILNDAWYHAAATYDGTTWRLYLNGQLDVQLTVDATPRYDSIQHSSLATAQTSSGAAAGYFAGILEEVRIWDYARSESEIRGSLGREVGVEPGLLGRWGLNEGAGSVAADAVGANDGAVVNATWVAGLEFADTLSVLTGDATGISSSQATLNGELLNLGDEASADVYFRWGLAPDALDQETTAETLTAAGEFSASLALPTPEVTYYYQAVAEGSSATAEGAVRSFFAADNVGLSLDGQNDYVTMGVAPTLGLATFTLEGWFIRTGAGKTAGSGSGGVTAVPLICKGVGESDGSVVDCNYFFGIQSGSNVLAADFEDLASGLNHPVVGTTPLEDDTWYHAAVTYDGATWRLYLDGTLDAELTVSATPRYDSIQHFGLGTAMNSSGSPNGYLAGRLDEVRVWDHARSEQQIKDNINAEIETADGLVGRWGLNEAGGSVAYDSTDNHNDGTLIGAAWAAGAPFDFVKPLVVRTLAASDLTPGSAVLNGELADLGIEDSAQVRFLWGTDPESLDQATGEVTLTDPAEFSAAITGLTPETQYYCQAEAYGATQSDLGEVVPFVYTDNYALRLDGVGDYATMGQAPGLGADTFTLECWFRRTGAGQTSSSGAGGFVGVPLVCKGRGEYDGDHVDCNYFFAIRSSDGVLGGDFEDMASGLNHPVFGTTPIEDNGWHHGAVTYDGTTWRLYLDGRLDGESSPGATPRYDSIQHFSIGTAMNSAGTPEGRLDGVIDEVRVWNYARTQEQILASVNAEVETGTGLLGRWGMNEGGGMTVYDSSGNGHDGSLTGGDWMLGAPFDLNLPPATPELVEPEYGATVRGPVVPLTAHVMDYDANDLEVTFHGRQLAADAPPPFTIIALPDTQYYSETYPEIFTAQTQWIVDNSEALSIAYVAHLGDIVDEADKTYQWQNADDAISVLDTQPALPYGLCVGNHDQWPLYDPEGTAQFNTWFPYTRYEGISPWYGGHYGSDNDNHFILFSAAGMDFVGIHLELDQDADPDVLAWTDGLLKTYADRRAILSSHYMIGTGFPGSWSAQGQAIYNEVKDNPNLFLMLCGHIHGEGRRIDTYGDSVVHTLLSDYQAYPSGGNGWLRIMEFTPANNEIHVMTYSPWLDAWDTSADSDFVISYDLSGVDFSELGTVSAVPSDSEVTFQWSPLDPLADFEWYVEVTDGVTSISGPVWTFSTGYSLGDADADGDVDADDHALLFDCYTGPGVACPTGCEEADLDLDTDADLYDFGLFERYFTGSAD